jgi:hypothetical protein
LGRSREINMAVTLTDRRSDTTNRHPVWEAVLDQMTWANGEGHASSSETIGLNGVITNIVMTMSSATNDPDVVLTVTDSQSNTLFTTTENDGQTVVDYASGDFGTNQLTSNGFTITADPTADSGATSLTVDIVVRGI